MTLRRSDLETAMRKSPILGELVDLVGLDITLAIVDWWGGADLYVPSKLPADDDHDLIRVAGRTAAKRISWTYAGCHLTIPKGYYIEKLIKAEQIFEGHKSGKKTIELAREYNYTARTIRKVIRECVARETAHTQSKPKPKKQSKPKPKHGQLDLFD